MTTDNYRAAPAQTNKNVDEFEDAPLHAVEEQQTQHLADDVHLQDLADDDYPQTKSGVRNSRETVLQNAKFQKGELVHMSVIANGARSKGVFKIYALVYNAAGWVDYQLVDVYTGQLRDRGAAFRERDLKRGT